MRILVLDTMLGWTGRHSRSQGEQVAALLASEGHEVSTASRRPNRLARLADMMWTVLRCRRSVDVVSIAVFSGPAFHLADIAARLTHRLGLPTVLVLHGGNLPSYADRHPDRVRRLLGRADVVVAPSSFNAERLASYLDGPIRIIPNVVDVETDAWRARPTVEPRIFWMRALQELYAPELAVAVMARLAERRPEARMTMAGPDKADLTPDLRAQIDELDLGDRIELVGFLDGEGKARQFNAHDVYLNTSRVDNTPVALLEAAAHGLVVVSTDAGGIPDLFEHDKTALLSAVGDADALAASLDAVLDDPDRATALALEARDHVQSMTWPQLGPQWIEVFEAAIGRS